MPGIGLIGCGAVATYCHLPALRRIRGVRLVAAADPDVQARSRAAAASGAQAFATHAELLAREDVHGVVISVPPALHAAVAADAVRAGKAIYLEKPVTLELEEARSLQALVADAGVEAVMGFNRRAHPLYVQARGLVRDGVIGTVRHVQMAFCEPVPPAGLPPWKLARATGGGALLDLASHHVDLLRWFLGVEVADVRSTSASLSSEEDHATVRLTMENGVTADGVYSFRAGYADHLEFTGERGSLRVDRHRARLDVRRARERGYGAAAVPVAPTGDVARWWLRRLVRRSEDPSYFHALRAFAGQVNGGPRVLASLEDGRRSLSVVLAAEASARTGHAARPTP